MSPVSSIILNVASAGGGGGGGGGTNAVRAFPISPNSEYATGFPIATVQSSTWILDWWPLVLTAYNGLTPQLDLLTAGTAGLLTSRGAAPMPLWVAATQPGGNTGLLVPGSASVPQSYGAAMYNFATTLGPPALTPQTFIEAGGNLLAVVSQDGTAQTPTAAFLTAANPPSPLPLIVTTGTNDRFVWTGTDPILGGGGAAPLTFTVAASGGGGYTGPNLATALAGALTGGVTPFSTYASVSWNNSTQLLTVTDIGGGAAGNGNSFSAPLTRDITAGAGFIPPGVLAGGKGGDPGSSAGHVTICVLVAGVTS